MKRTALYEKAKERYGEDAQKLQAIEELNELSKEVIKDLKGCGTPFHIADEIADVEIMLEQLKLMYGVGELVYERKRYKKKRLEKRL